MTLALNQVKEAIAYILCNSYAAFIELSHRRQLRRVRMWGAHVAQREAESTDKQQQATHSEPPVE